MEAVRVLGLVRQNHARQILEVNFERRVELEEAAELRLPQIIEAGPESVVAMRDGEVVLELVLGLIGLLRHVGVRAEADAGRESEERNFLVRVNQVVPVLVADRRRVHNSRREDGVQRRVGDDELVRREIAFGQVNALARLVVEAGVALVAVAEEGRVLGAEGVVQARVPARVVIGRRNLRGWLRAESRDELKLCERVRRDRDGSLLVLPLKGEEEEGVALGDWPADGAAENLPVEGGFGLVAELGEVVVGVQLLVAQEEEARAVKVVAARFSDDVDGRALAAPVGG